MIVDMAVALGPNFDVDQGMARQLIEHMIEETNAGCNISKARPIEIEANLNARLIRLACDCALAHRDAEALSWFVRGGDSKTRAAWPPQLRRDTRRLQVARASRRAKIQLGRAQTPSARKTPLGRYRK